MGPLRRFGLSSLDAVVVAAIVLVLAALALAGAIAKLWATKTAVDR